MYIAPLVLFSALRFRLVKTVADECLMPLAEYMLRSEYHIPGMDCSSEENMIRLKLDGMEEIKKLEFDLGARRLVVYHTDVINDLTESLEDLDLGSKWVDTSEYKEVIEEQGQEVQSKLLWTVLAINFGFFLIEITAGLFSRSMGLMADSLDMLADAFVYGLSLLAVGSTVTKKKSVARWSGILQFALAGLGLIEVLRRFFGTETLPDFRTMIIVSVLALIANSVCLYLLQRSKSQEAHMKASMIFTSNDVIINSGVILAGVLVLLTQSRYPDLMIGGIVFIVVVRGAIRMVKLSR